MVNPWLNLLSNLPLSKTEREVVKRFNADPSGRTFLPIADILRSHKLIDESLELMVQGVTMHPGFTVARVVLVRELLNKGMVAEAWRNLDESPVSLRDNVLAQKLRFKLAILIGSNAIATSTYHHLKVQHMLDAETQKLGEQFEGAGLLAARRHLTKSFEERGTTLTLPKLPLGNPEEVKEVDAKEKRGLEPPISKPERSTEEFNEHDISPKFSAVQTRTMSGADPTDSSAGFHVVPLSEILRPGDVPRLAELTKAPGGIELDSTTLADIYANQGHFSKALDIYRRLLRMTPRSDLLKRKVGELAKLAREQKDIDLTIDPSIVDQMEQIEIIDEQMRLLNHMLAKLT